MMNFSETKSLNRDERDLLRSGLADLTVGQVLEMAEEGRGTLYTVYNGDALEGVLFFLRYGSVLNLRSYSAPRFKEWAIEMQEFVISLMRKYEIPEFQILTRYGWHKHCPKLKFEGCLYSFFLADDTPPETSKDSEGQPLLSGS